jgi:hypothetical protein
MLRALLPIGAALAATPLLAATSSAVAGGHSFTATISDHRLASISVDASSAPMTLRAWYVDDAGAILGEASLGKLNSNGMATVALAKSSVVPANANALVVVAQPAGLSRTATADAPAVIARIALP